MSFEVWMKRNGDLVSVEWNPCGCHPNDVTVLWGKRGQGLHYPGVVKKRFERSLKKMGWQRLQK